MVHPSASQADGSQWPDFQQTQWSIVANSDGDDVARQESLERLCRRYVFPVFAYLRGAHNENDAYLYAQGFLQHLYQQVQQQRPEGRFRAFLLEQLSAYAQAPSTPAEPLKGIPTQAALTARYDNEPMHIQDPDAAFESRFAREIMVRALARLEREALENDRGILFRELVRYITREPTKQQWQALGDRLDTSRVALRIALNRLRARYVEIGNGELAETVGDSRDLAAERNTIHTILGRDQADPTNSGA